MTGRLLEGSVLHRWVRCAVDGLEQAGPRIDAVNVFPVADQDTGTNCLLTVRGAAEELVMVADNADGPTVLAALARGALLAARGNSGMILSHWFAGLARGAEQGFAGALSTAAQSARSAIAEPEPGTVLDLAAEVARAARDEARSADGSAAASGDDRRLLTAAIAAGHAAVGEISDRHPVLRAARVLDAGACALLVVLSAWAAAAEDTPERLDLGWLPDVCPPALPDRSLPGFEVMAVLPAGDDPQLRDRLAMVGEAVAVVSEPGDGPGRLRQVHVHVDDPAAAVAAIQDAGGGEPVLVGVQRLSGSAIAAVAVTGSPQRAREMAQVGAVVLVASAAPATVWRLALDRAVRDAQAGGAHCGERTTNEPVPVLPGPWLSQCAQVLPSGSTLVAEADDDDRVLAVLHALAGPVPA